FALGDAEFVKRTLLKGVQKEGSSDVVGSGIHADAKPEPVENAVSPEQLVLQMTFAEQSYASAHPDVGFTCSLSELAEAVKAMGFEQQLASGIYKGYKLSLTGCQGRPAGSYQITAEPVQGNAGKAFCTDATHNIRIADDGRGSTCLAFGRTPAKSEGDETSVRFTPEAHTEFMVTAPPVKDKD